MRTVKLSLYKNVGLLFFPPSDSLINTGNMTRSNCIGLDIIQLHLISITASNHLALLSTNFSRYFNSHF